MIIHETTVQDNKEYVRTYSDQDLYIKDSNGDMFEEAIELVENQREYSETDVKIVRESANQSDFMIEDKVNEILRQRYPDFDVPTYSKYKLMEYLVANNQWLQFKTWMNQPENEIMKDMWDVIIEFAEGDPNFEKFQLMFKTQFGLSDQQLETIKDYCRK